MKTNSIVAFSYKNEPSFSRGVARLPQTPLPHSLYKACRGIPTPAPTIPLSACINLILPSPRYPPPHPQLPPRIPLPPPLPQKQEINRIQISHSQLLLPPKIPQPLLSHPHPPPRIPLFPLPQKHNKIRIQMMLPHPHPLLLEAAQPQLVAVKSLMMTSGIFCFTVIIVWGRA